MSNTVVLGHEFIPRTKKQVIRTKKNVIPDLLEHSQKIWSFHSTDIEWNSLVSSSVSDSVEKFVSATKIAEKLGNSRRNSIFATKIGLDSNI